MKQHWTFSVNQNYVDFKFDEALGLENAMADFILTSWNTLGGCLCKHLETEIKGAQFCIRNFLNTFYWIEIMIFK